MTTRPNMRCNGLSAVRSGVADIRERAVRSTCAAEAVAELGSLGASLYWEQFAKCPVQPNVQERHLCMKKTSSIAFGFASLLTVLTIATAADRSPPGKYSLSVARVYESSPSRPEWVFIFGGTGSLRGGETVCKSVASLKKLLAGLPRGSTLDWSPTCDSEESKVLEGDIEDLKTICHKAGVTFTIHPSG